MNKIEINGETYVKESEVKKVERTQVELYVERIKEMVDNEEQGGNELDQMLLWIKNSIDSKKTLGYNIGDYVIVRTYSAGVFAGNLISRDGKEVKMENARRLWYWKGAASLSQLAMEGVKCPSECKFAMPVTVTLLETIEILEVTEVAKEIIEGVFIWKE